MKIAIDARIIFTSTGRYVHCLLDELQQVDRQNDYVVLLNEEGYKRWLPTADNFKKVLADYQPYSFPEQTSFGRLLQKLDVDLVHFTMPQHPVAYSGKHIITIHDLTLVDYINRRDELGFSAWYRYKIKPFVFRWIIKRGLRKAAHVISPTNYVRQQIISRYKINPNKISFTHEAGSSLAVNPTPYAPLANQNFILAVGNAYPYKNLPRLIDAFAATNLKDHQLVLVGKTDYFYEQLKKYVHDNHIQNVHFTGFIPDSQLAWLYQHANLYVFPSLSEGFGLPGLEAMSYGAPVASSNATCLPEVYGDAAAYFDPNSTEDMAKIISETLGDKMRLAELKKKGSAQVKKYSWEKMARQTLEIYQQALKK